MPTDSLLALLDEDTKRVIFERSVQQLDFASLVDLDGLRTCISLAATLHPSAQSHQALLWDRVLHWIASVQRVPDEETPRRLYEVADICLNNGHVVATQFHDKFYHALTTSLTRLRTEASLSKSPAQPLQSSESTSPSELAAAYLSFLRCSFWLPPDRYHLINADCFSTVASFIGLETEVNALESISALLSLLWSSGQIKVAGTLDILASDASSTIAVDTIAGLLLGRESQHQDLLWAQIEQLSPQSWQACSGKVMKVWFQWISQARVAGLEPRCLHTEVYWQMLSDRLSRGFAEEQKYCLGIINQSLLLAKRDIVTKTMVYNLGLSHQKAYEQYATLFRTIVLNRYPNQVEACLPELTTLLGADSKITPAFAASLLSAALDSRVQEGVRKLIGYWCVDHIGKNDRAAIMNMDFFTGGFLPWATDGNLFTSSLRSNRKETTCSHGNSLSNLVARLVSIQGTVSELGDGLPRQDGAIVISEIVRFIKNAGGRIFQSAILYLLEGVLAGLQKRHDTNSLNALTASVSSSELTEILSIARLPGLPEISSDLLAIYCREICLLIEPNLDTLALLGSAQLKGRVQRLRGSVNDTSLPIGNYSAKKNEIQTIEEFVVELTISKHRSIQSDFAGGCSLVASILDRTEASLIPQHELHEALQAFWDEAERCEFGRPLAMHLPSVLFHPTCVTICVQQHSIQRDVAEDSLQGLLSRALLRLQQLSKGRAYVLSVLAPSIRAAVLSNPSIATCLPIAEFVLEFLNNPPTSKPEFLFEVAAAEKLERIVEHRTYTSYYGQREWHAYAALIDLLRRWPQEQLHVAQKIMAELVKPWRDQKVPVPIKSPWKETLQLQGMLMISDYCITEANANEYLNSLMYALSHEPWPRYRYLLEWIIARIYYRFPGKTIRILDDLTLAAQHSPVHIASLIKLGLLVAPFESERFTTRLLLHLVCFSASPKVHIRHEANFAFPLLFSLAEDKQWEGILTTATFIALDNYIRQMDKFHADPWTIRTLRLDAINDFSITSIFQGRYLSIESPEKERAAYEDFVALEARDRAEGRYCPLPRIPLGEEVPPMSDATTLTSRFEQVTKSGQAPGGTPGFLQTKAGFDIDSIYPPPNMPFAENQRPASIILVASLIDNPTNLGGLSRISESFGLEALYIDDLKKTTHKDFKATSVTSEKHFPIRALQVPDMPQFLIDAKRRGYVVVGVEQTDHSGILGEDRHEEEGGGKNKMRYRKDVGTLPKKCVLVLGAEKSGISPEVLTVVDRCVEIRTVGVTRSLNVQTAGGIAVYEWWREWGGQD
ncbi:hypothetical protein NX059_010990 [Plenodomus lindquistii]|nr:hypothetical protein NX059_010990 [Plenodomus lindquistii]